MILTSGLSPAWQQILVFEPFRAGQVNRAIEARWCASGKVFNAGIAAARLGGPSLTVAPVGGPSAPQIVRELDCLGVPHRLVETKSATRICTTVLDRPSGQMTELVENGLPMTSHELEQFLAAHAEEAARAEVAVIIGSLPSGVPHGYYRQLLERTKCPAVLDFRGPGLTGLLDLRPFVVKLNREELVQTVGRSLASDDALLDAMRQLNRAGAQWVVVTDGPKPVYAMSSGGVHRLHPPAVEEIVNPIACGDAMAAAIAWATRRGDAPVEAVRFGIGASLENLGQLLPCRLNLAEVERLADQTRVETA